MSRYEIFVILYLCWAPVSYFASPRVISKPTIYVYQFIFSCLYKNLGNDFPLAASSEKLGSSLATLKSPTTSPSLTANIPFIGWRGGGSFADFISIYFYFQHQDLSLVKLHGWSLLLSEKKKIVIIEIYRIPRKSRHPPFSFIGKRRACLFSPEISCWKCKVKPPPTSLQSPQFRSSVHCCALWQTRKRLKPLAQILWPHQTKLFYILWEFLKLLKLFIFLV